MKDLYDVYDLYDSFDKESTHVECFRELIDDWNRPVEYFGFSF